MEKIAKKAIFGQIWAHFGPKPAKKFTEIFFQLSYLNIYYFLSSCKKSENFSHSMARKSQKTLFLGQFGPILAQNGPKNLSKKKIMLSYLNNYYFVSSCKKSENFSSSTARKSQKNFFWANWAHFGPKRPK